MARTPLTLSVTRLQAYLACPAKYYFQFEAKDVPERTDYPLVCGKAVHRFVQLLYKKPKDERPFFYKTKKNALSAWFSHWQRALGENADKLVQVDHDEEERHKLIGLKCVSNYWDGNFEKPRPIEIEQPYIWQIIPGLKIKGIPDQIRRVPIEWIRRFRPELLEGDQIKEGYAPAVIIDLKTDYLDYDVRRFKENPTLIDEVREQFNLHAGLQATTYSWLYEKVTGLRPAGFLWYHLRSGKVFPTFREERDYERLFRVIKHVVENLEAESFPTNDGKHCRYCPYYAPCWEDRCLLISRPTVLPDNPLEIDSIPALVHKSPTKQLRLKLKYGRSPAKKPKTAATANEQKPIILKSLPWDDPKAKQLPESKTKDN